jgi:hypothetical protein
MIRNIRMIQAGYITSMRETRNPSEMPVRKLQRRDKA